MFQYKFSAVVGLFILKWYFSSHIKLLSTLDPSWTTNSSNGLHAHGHPHWLQLQLATAKLLDLSLILPATALPQFQM